MSDGSPGCRANSDSTVDDENSARPLSVLGLVLESSKESRSRQLTVRSRGLSSIRRDLSTPGTGGSTQSPACVDQASLGGQLGVPSGGRIAVPPRGRWVTQAQYRVAPAPGRPAAVPGPCRRIRPPAGETDRKFAAEFPDLVGVIDPIPITATLRALYWSATRCNRGISSTHGVHQVAQKFTTSSLPRHSDKRPVPAIGIIQVQRKERCHRRVGRSRRSGRAQRRGATAVATTTMRRRPAQPQPVPARSGRLDVPWRLTHPAAGSAPGAGRSRPEPLEHRHAGPALPARSGADRGRAGARGRTRSADPGSRTVSVTATAGSAALRDRKSRHCRCSRRDADRSGPRSRCVAPSGRPATPICTRSDTRSRARPGQLAMLRAAPGRTVAHRAPIPGSRMREAPLHVGRPDRAALAAVALRARMVSWHRTCDPAVCARPLRRLRPPAGCTVLALTWMMPMAGTGLCPKWRGKLLVVNSGPLVHAVRPKRCPVAARGPTSTGTQCAVDSDRGR